MTTENRTNDRIEDHPRVGRSVSRRTTLGLLGLGSLGVLAGAASAQPPANGPGQPGGPVYNWERDVDANGHALSALGSLAMADNPTPITDIAGRNLSIDGDGVLNAIGSPWRDGDGDGLLGTSSDGIEVGTVETADLAVGNVGISVFATGNQFIDSNATETVEFDVRKFDQKGEFDQDTNEFVAAEDGFYSVSMAIQCESPGEGEDLFLVMFKNDDFAALDKQAGLPASLSSLPGSPDMYLSITKLLELAAGDTVAAKVVNEGDSSVQLRTAESRVWMTVHRVG